MAQKEERSAGHDQPKCQRCGRPSRVGVCEDCQKKIQDRE